MTLMLIVVIAFFLSTEIPLMVITMLHTLSSRCQTIINPCISDDDLLILFSFGFFLLDYNIAKNIVLAINALICFSYPFNFAIYCGMSR